MKKNVKNKDNNKNKNKLDNKSENKTDKENKFKKEIRLKNLNNLENFEDSDDDEKSIKLKKEKEILLNNEDEDNIKEKFETLLTNCDLNRIGKTDILLKENPSKIKNEDLIYYLRCKLNNSNLDDTNKSKTDTYLKNISNNFKYENIFINQSNYTTLVFAGVCLLLPFYFYYPNVYNMGFFGIFIGLIGMSSLTPNVQKYASFQNIDFKFNNLFKHLHIKLLFFSLLFYFIFFVYICKLNHISLFFISYFIVYLMMTYILKIILSNPSDSNIFIKYKATYKKNDDASKLYSNIETACSELNKRFNLEFPNNQILYNYLTFVDLQEKESKNVGDFISYLFQPYLVIFLLLLSGNFFNSYINKEFNIQTVPVIGFNNDTLPFLMCQANYILPDELNYKKIIIEILEKYYFDKDLERKIAKFLNKIGDAFIEKFKPYFYYVNKNSLKTLFDTDLSFQDFEEEISDKMNYLVNEDEEINEKNKPLIFQIFGEFCLQYKTNLEKAKNNNLNYNNSIVFNSNQNETIGYSKTLIQNLFGVLSTWLIVSKFLGSGWFLSKYILSYFGSFANILETYKRNWIPWKLSTLGVDNFVFSNFLEKNQIDLSSSGNTIIQWIGQVFLWIFISIPFLTTITQAVFGFSFSPKYINMIWIILVLGNMMGNKSFYKTEPSDKDVSLTTWNVGYIVVSIMIMLAITVGIMMNKNKKNNES